MRGELRFLCHAETADLPDDSQALLNGRVFIITDPARWQKTASQISEIQRELQSYAYSATSSPIEDLGTLLTDRLDKIGNDNCAFQAAFSLRRNGIINITVEDDVVVAAEAPKFPTDPVSRRHIRHILAAQIFSFIRDIGHQHQHHSPKSDTIVDLFEVESDDGTWRISTLYSIYRRIISYKRRHEIDQQIFSLGLLAYAKAFRHICEEDGIEKLPVYYDAELRESIQASELRIKHLNQTSHERSATLRTVILALAAITISLTNIPKLASPQPTFKVAWEWTLLTRLVVSNPALVIILFVSLLWYAHGLRTGRIRPETEGWSRAWQARTQGFGKAIAVGARLALAAALLVLAVVVIYLRFSHWW